MALVLRNREGDGRKAIGSLFHDCHVEVVDAELNVVELVAGVLGEEFRRHFQGKNGVRPNLEDHYGEEGWRAFEEGRVFSSMHYGNCVGESAEQGVLQDHHRCAMPQYYPRTTMLSDYFPSPTVYNFMHFTLFILESYPTYHFLSFFFFFFFHSK